MSVKEPCRKSFPRRKAIASPSGAKTGWQSIPGARVKRVHHTAADRQTPNRPLIGTDNVVSVRRQARMNGPLEHPRLLADGLGRLFPGHAALLRSAAALPCPASPDSEVLGNHQLAVAVGIPRIENALGQCGMRQSGTAVADKLSALNEAILIVVHPLQQGLGLIRDEAIQDVFGSTHGSIPVGVRRHEDASAGLSCQVGSVLDVLDLRMAPVAIAIDRSELTIVKVQGRCRCTKLIAGAQSLQQVGAIERDLLSKENGPEKGRESRHGEQRHPRRYRIRDGPRSQHADNLPGFASDCHVAKGRSIDAPAILITLDSLNRRWPDPSAGRGFGFAKPGSAGHGHFMGPPPQRFRNPG